MKRRRHRKARVSRRRHRRNGYALLINPGGMFGTKRRRRRKRSAPMRKHRRKHRARRHHRKHRRRRNPGLAALMANPRRKRRRRSGKHRRRHGRRHNPFYRRHRRRHHRRNPMALFSGIKEVVKDYALGAAGAAAANVFLMDRLIPTQWSNTVRAGVKAVAFPAVAALGRKFLPSMGKHWTAFGVVGFGLAINELFITLYAQMTAPQAPAQAAAGLGYLAPALRNPTRFGYLAPAGYAQQQYGAGLHGFGQARRDYYADDPNYALMAD